MVNYPVHCCIVDDHCDIVPFIYAYWRIYKLPLPPPSKAADFCFIHFDAHPDLSIPSDGSCISDWRDKDRLFDALRTEGGISEFIIPLVTNLFISKVKWIRPPWSSQFADEEVSIKLFDSVCDESGKKKPFTSFQRSPYYIDDGCAMSEPELLTEPFLTHGTSCFSFLLDVGTCDGIRIKLPKDSSDACEPINWILDICLDYFSTINPFRLEIVRSLKEDLCIEDDAAVDAHWQVIQNAFHFMRFRHCGGIVSSSHQQEGSAHNIRKWRQESLTAFNCETLGDAEREHSAFTALYSEEHMSAASAYIDLVRKLRLSTRQLIVQSGSMLLLPHHRSNSEEIASLMQDMEGYLRDVLLLHGPPRFVTIAKSAEDGYTPPQQVDELCAAVLAMLRSVFSLDSEQHSGLSSEITPSLSSCPGQSPRRMLCIHDLSGEDVYSEAYPSLLRAKLRGESRASSSVLGTKRKAELLRKHGIDVA